MTGRKEALEGAMRGKKKKIAKLPRSNVRKTNHINDKKGEKNVKHITKYFANVL